MSRHSNDDIRPVWSDAELDAALAGLHAEVGTDDQRLARSRTALLVAAGSQDAATAPVRLAPPARATAPLGARRPSYRLLGAAAAVLALVGGGLVVQAVAGGDQPGLTAAAAGLTSAAERIRASDPTVGPGQFRYIATHGTARILGFGAKVGTARGEGRIELWVPADETGTWMRRDTSVGGSGGFLDGSWKASCGRFFAPSPPQAGRCPGGSWEEPTATWIAGLPRDPALLYDRLLADAPDNGLGDVQQLTTAGGALATGRLPAEVRSALYRALAMIPTLRITDGAANLDGRIGVAYAVSGENGTRQELIIDPDTGEFIGSREVLTRDTPAMKAGTVRAYTAVSSSVVDRIGERPAR